MTNFQVIAAYLKWREQMERQYGPMIYSPITKGVK